MILPSASYSDADPHRVVLGNHRNRRSDEPVLPLRSFVVFRAIARKRPLSRHGTQCHLRHAGIPSRACGNVFHVASNQAFVSQDSPIPSASGVRKKGRRKPRRRISARPSGHERVHALGDARDHLSINLFFSCGSWSILVDRNALHARSAGGGKPLRRYEKTFVIS